MPAPTRDPKDPGSTLCTVAPGETRRRIGLQQSSDLSWTLGALNKATNAAATFEVTVSHADDEDQIIVPLGISADGTLAAGESVILPQPTRIRAILVTVPAEADGSTLVVALQ